MSMIYRSSPPEWKRFKPDLTADCPHCDKPVGITLVSAPNAQLVEKHSLETVGAVYKCEGCKRPIHFQYYGCRASHGDLQIQGGKQITHARPRLDLSNVTNQEVKNDVEEALDCYGVGAWNGFAAMCRRVLQSIYEDRGVKGSSKVQKQTEVFISTYDFDDEMKEILREITQTGHDGAHPFLPVVSEQRAQKLLVFLREIVHQIYDLPASLGESKQLREEAIASKKIAKVPNA